MRATFSISRRDIFTTSGELDTTLYELRAEIDETFSQDIQLEHIDDLVALRDAIDNYLQINNFKTIDNEH